MPSPPGAFCADLHNETKHPASLLGSAPPTKTHTPKPTNRHTRSQLATPTPSHPPNPHQHWPGPHLRDGHQPTFHPSTHALCPCLSFSFSFAHFARAFGFALAVSVLLSLQTLQNLHLRIIVSVKGGGATKHTHHLVFPQKNRHARKDLQNDFLQTLP